MRRRVRPPQLSQMTSFHFAAASSRSGWRGATLGHLQGGRSAIVGPHCRVEQYCVKMMSVRRGFKSALDVCSPSWTTPSSCISVASRNARRDVTGRQLGQSLAIRTTLGAIFAATLCASA